MNLEGPKKLLRQQIIEKKVSELGGLSVVSDEVEVDIYAGHPICSPPLGWCAPGNYIGGSYTACPSGPGTSTWCAS